MCVVKNGAVSAVQIFFNKVDMIKFSEPSCAYRYRISLFPYSYLKQNYIEMG